MTLRHFLSAADLNRAEAEALLDRAAMLKAAWRAGQVNDRPC